MANSIRLVWSHSQYLTPNPNMTGSSPGGAIFPARNFPWARSSHTFGQVSQASLSNEDENWGPASAASFVTLFRLVFNAYGCRTLLRMLNYLITMYSGVVPAVLLFLV